MSKLPRGLKTLTIVVRVLVVLIGLFMLGGAGLTWLQPEWAREWALASLKEAAGGGLITLDTRARVLGALAELPGTGLQLFALGQLWQLFGHYGSGRFFDSVTLRPMRRFGWSLFFAALLAPFDKTLLVLALTIGNPPGQQMLTLGLSADHLNRILMSAVMLAIGLVLTEAARLAEENQSFI
jgi:hypothetical protein